MKNLFLGAVFAAIAGTAMAAPERTFPVGGVLIESIKIEGSAQSWELQKVCLDGQAYFLVSGVSGPGGMSASFKNGRPERCPAKRRGR